MLPSGAVQAVSWFINRKDAAAAHFLHQQAFQLVSTVSQPVPIGSIDDPNQRVGLLEVILPVRAKGLLTADIP